MEGMTGYDPAKSVLKHLDIEIMGTLPPLAHSIALTYFYFVNEKNPLASIEVNWPDFFEALQNTVFLNPSGREYSGADRRQVIETLKKMNHTHFDVWRSGWSRSFNRKKGQWEETKELWRLYGVVLPFFKLTYHVEPGQDEDLLTEEEKEGLPLKGIRMQLAEPLLSGLSKKGIGYSIGYHKRIMQLFHDLGKAWIPKLLTTWLLRQKSMSPEIGKRALLEWCGMGGAHNRARNLQALNEAVKTLRVAKVLLNVEEEIPFKYGKNNQGDQTFDRYFKNPEWFPQWGVENQIEG